MWIAYNCSNILLSFFLFFFLLLSSLTSTAGLDPVLWMIQECCTKFPPFPIPHTEPIHQKMHKRRKFHYKIISTLCAFQIRISTLRCFRETRLETLSAPLADNGCVWVFISLREGKGREWILQAHHWPIMNVWIFISLEINILDRVAYPIPG